MVTINDLAQSVPKNYIITVFRENVSKQTIDNAEVWFAAGTYESLDANVLSVALSSIEAKPYQNSIIITAVILEPEITQDPGVIAN